MKNYISSGELLTVTAADDTDHQGGVSGDGVLTGFIFGVAVTDFLPGADVVVNTEGVFDMLKPGSQAWTVGAKIYWDDAARKCTTTSSGNKEIGVAVKAVGSGAGETTGRVSLNGFAI